MTQCNLPKKYRFILSLLFVFSFFEINAQSNSDWYSEGDDYSPTQRMRITVTNPINIARENCPIIVQRNKLPIQNIPERWINIVDPNLPGNPEPTASQLKEEGGYVRRKETNGHYLDIQVDDLDKNGVWDEIYFMSDFKANETKEFYIYIHSYERGLAEHQVHANIGYYGRHIVPMWESDYMGWKLWYPDAADLHGKREPMLTAYYEYSTNKSGYYMPEELGSDIMTVGKTFGSGGIGLIENVLKPEHQSRPDHSPSKNKGPLHDTRYAYDVVVNGPLRSIIKVTTTNWNSGQGSYELEQFYTAVAHKSWSTVEVKFTEFLAPNRDIMFTAGIREIMNEYKAIQKKGFAISMGQNIESRIPDEDLGEEVTIVPWQGIGIIVKDAYRPMYLPIKTFGGNHLFKMPVTPDLSFEYMIVGGWSFGTVNNDEPSFIKYMEDETFKYNHPPIVKIDNYEIKDQ